MKDPHGAAIVDYFNGNRDHILLLHNNYGEPEEMPVEVFFRDDLDFSVLENLALIECKGKVLDVGAGAGAHSLALQSRGFELHALENSAGCVDVLTKSGIRNVHFMDFHAHTEKYDTLLVLMNGIGLAGTLDKVGDFLKKCMDRLNPNGQLLIDSSDISYLYEEGIPRPSGYHGEVRYQYEYKGEKGEWFEWVYVDQQTLRQLTDKLGLKLEVLMTDEHDQYLACITK